MYRTSGIIFLCLSFLTFCLSVLAEDQLIFVNILYRHGDRTPVKPYPLDPYRNKSYWPVEFGQLTNTGKMQHYELGQWLRNRYPDFIPEKYSVNDIYVRSTDVDRTLMSAESNLAGLYSPKNSDIWNPNLFWQPIPVHTVPEKSDAVVGAKKHCPRYDMELNKLKESIEFRKMNLKLKPLYKYLSNHTGKNIYDIQELEYIYNTLFIESLYGLKLPDWTTGVFPEQMKPWAEFSFKLYCYTPRLQRLKVGLLLNEIMTRFTNKTNNLLNPDRRIWMYSAHDTTIANTLMALGAFDRPHCPPYTATILLELWKNSNGIPYVSAYYKNDTIGARPISILGCEQRCPLDKMALLLAPIMLKTDEWEAECQSLSAPLVSTIAAIAVVSCGVLLLLLLVSLCVGAACSKHHQQLNRNHQLYQPLADEVN